MAKVFPGGSSVTRVFPPSLTPGPPAVAAIGPWTVRYEVDWTAEAAHNFKTEGAVATVGGVNWAMSDGGNAQTGAITSNGLEISCDPTTTSDWPEGGTLSAPRFYVALDVGTNPMFAAANLYQAFCFQAVITSSADVSTDAFYGTALQNGDASRWATSLREYNSLVWGSPYKGHQMTAQLPEANFSSESSATATQHTFYELTFLPSGTILASSSTATTLQDPMSQTAFQAFLATNTSVTDDPDATNWDKDELYFLYMAGNPNALGPNITHTMTHFRLLSAGE